LEIESVATSFASAEIPSRRSSWASGIATVSSSSPRPGMQSTIPSTRLIGGDGEALAEMISSNCLSFPTGTPSSEGAFRESL
jgi:hypothetical protein